MTNTPTVEHELTTTNTEKFRRGNRTLLERNHELPVDQREWNVPVCSINERELAGLAYFAIRELTPLLLVVFAEHDKAASGSMIQRLLDSLSWIAEELGGTPIKSPELSAEQRDSIREAFVDINEQARMEAAASQLNSQ